MGAKTYSTRYFTTIYTNIFCMPKYEKPFRFCVLGSAYYRPYDCRCNGKCIVQTVLWGSEALNSRRSSSSSSAAGGVVLML